MSLTIGDRYIAKVTANGWTANYIYEWNGATWGPNYSCSR